MASYFNVKDADDLDLLPARLHDADQLAIVATLAEADVIEHYTAAVDPLLRGWYQTPYRTATQIGTSNRWVYLRGYTTDADDAAVDAALKTALKRTVAEVVRWRLAQQRVDPLVEAESNADGAKTVTYRDNAQDPFPPSWDRWLASFDTRELF